MQVQIASVYIIHGQFMSKALCRFFVDGNTVEIFSTVNFFVCRFFLLEKKSPVMNFQEVQKKIFFLVGRN